MEEQEDQQRRSDLISGLFVLLTAKMEDAATIAADCQAARPSSQLLEGAGKIADLSREAMTVAAAVSAILEIEISETSSPAD